MLAVLFIQFLWCISSISSNILALLAAWHSNLMPACTYVNTDCARSSNYGSPNFRNRCYIVGARKDISEFADLNRAVHFARVKCRSFHTRSSLNDCSLLQSYIVPGSYDMWYVCFLNLCNLIPMLHDTPLLFPCCLMSVCWFVTYTHGLMFKVSGSWSSWSYTLSHWHQIHIAHTFF